MSKTAAGKPKVKYPDIITPYFLAPNFDTYPVYVYKLYN